jgi:hypothetical protein
MTAMYVVCLFVPKNRYYNSPSSRRIVEAGSVPQVDIIYRDVSRVCIVVVTSFLTWQTSRSWMPCSILNDGHVWHAFGPTKNAMT